MCLIRDAEDICVHVSFAAKPAKGQDFSNLCCSFLRPCPLGLSGGSPGPQAPTYWSHKDPDRTLSLSFVQHLPMAPTFLRVKYPQALTH